MTRSRGVVLWLFGNICGAAIYLHFASRLWPPAELRATADALGPADAFIWAMTVLPTLVVCAVFNLAVLVWSAQRWKRSSAWPLTRSAWLIPVLWATACTVDHAHF